MSTVRPKLISPYLPILARVPPNGPGWVPQCKLDGYRFLHGHRVRFFSKGRTEWSDRLPALVEAFATLQTDFILDGELRLCDDRGRPDFRGFHAEMHQRRPDTSRMCCFSFDLLWEHDVDLRRLPLSERQRRWPTCMGGSAPIVRERTEERCRLEDILQPIVARTHPPWCRGQKPGREKIPFSCWLPSRPAFGLSDQERTMKASDRHIESDTALYDSDFMAIEVCNLIASTEARIDHQRKRVRAAASDFDASMQAVSELDKLTTALEKLKAFKARIVAEA